MEIIFFCYMLSCFILCSKNVLTNSFFAEMNEKAMRDGKCIGANSYRVRVTLLIRMTEL